MPMMVTDATLPGNPIVFANKAFAALSRYAMEELVGQDPHFLNGDGTDPAAIRPYIAAVDEKRDETLEIVQHRGRLAVQGYAVREPARRRPGDCHEPRPVLPRHLPPL